MTHLEKRISNIELNIDTAFILMLTLLFTMRGLTIFSITNSALIPTITIFDIATFIFLGIFISIFVILGYNKKLLIILLCSWEVGIIFNTVISVIYALGSRMFSDINAILLALSTTIILVVLSFIWKKSKTRIQEYYESLSSDWIKKYSPKQYFKVILVTIGIIGFSPFLIVLLTAILLAILFVGYYSDQAILQVLMVIILTSGISYYILTSLMTFEKCEQLWNNYIANKRLLLKGIFSVVFLLLLGLSAFTPRLCYNTITNHYTGSEDIIEAYLSLDVKEYFPGINNLEDLSINSFRLTFNFLGANERKVMSNIITSSNYKARTSIDYTGWKFSQITEQEIFANAGYLFLYNYGYWNNTLHLIEEDLEEIFTNFSWSDGTIGMVKEEVDIDNTVGNSMRFYQLIVFLSTDKTILVVLSGFRMSHYD